MSKKYKYYTNKPESIDVIYNDIQKHLDGRHEVWETWETTYNSLNKLVHDLKTFAQDKDED